MGCGMGCGGGGMGCGKKGGKKMTKQTELETEKVKFREHQEAWRLNNHAQAAEIERLKTEIEQLNLRFLLLRPHHQNRKTHP
jgi:hypothetical protein